jgi:hypothetical protein
MEKFSVGPDEINLEKQNKLKTSNTFTEFRIIYLFIFLQFKNCELNNCYIPGTKLGFGGKGKKKIDKTHLLPSRNSLGGNKD